MTNEVLKAQLLEKSKIVEAYLASCLNLLPDIPRGLREAMEYSLLAGGKRLRPVLCLSFVEAFGDKNKQNGVNYVQKALPFASAIECIHTYSLIHDDLPAMDNDNLRRGRPTNHIRFDEATAILAGDALVTDAFYLMTNTAKYFPAERVLAAISCLAKAAGSPGMVGGQFLDMLYTNTQTANIDQIKEMQAMKTGAMLQAACQSGAILGGASTTDLQAVAQYGACLGAAFQIMDDVLDEIGDPLLLGKPVGSDEANAKTTYTSLLGIEQSKTLAQQEVEKAISALPDVGSHTDFFKALAHYVVERNK